MRSIKSLASALALAAGLGACSDAPSPVAPPLDASLASADVRQQASRDHDVTLPDVALRPGVTADLVAHVYVNERRPSASCDARGTVLAVYGFAHTAATWGPLAEALFASDAGSACRVIALDLPGHGASALPDVLPFGYLTLDDYASAVLGALGQLSASGLDARAIVAHSQGGIVVQLAQHRLVQQGSSLRAAHGIDAVVLMSPTMPNGLSWAFADQGIAMQLLSNFLVLDDPVLGPHFAAPDAAWSQLFFSRLDYTVVPTAPTPAEVTARGYNAPEPFLSALQLVGAAPYFSTRPEVAAGVFAPSRGSRLTIIGLEQDQLVRPEEAGALYDHLAGAVPVRAFTTVGGPESVHDMFVSNPAALLDGIGAALRR